MNRFDYSKGLSLAEALVDRNPNDDYSQSYLGRIYLTMGDLTNSEIHFSRAYELWPTEANEKNLAAIRKRLAKDRK